MFGFGIFNGPPRPFNVSYRCYSVSMLPGNERQDVENGGKIILPPSALEHLTRLNVVYPMLFKLTNPKTERSTHCGVLEFVADEGKCYIPYWMMRNLMCEEGTVIRIDSATLPVASFSKFEPQSVEFLDITNPKAMLENALRSFACLTTGDVIAIRYNDKLYELRVLETRPGQAVSIIECDMDVDFAPPIDYVDPTPAPPVQEESSPELESPMDINNFIPFGGSGNRLDGKTAGCAASAENGIVNYRRGVPDFDFEIGNLVFMRNSRPSSSQNDKNSEKGFTAFAGRGITLKSKPAD